MDNFSSAQYDRFEAYRRHALPKQAVRKVRSNVVCLQAPKYMSEIGYPTDTWTTSVSACGPNSCRFWQSIRRRNRRERLVAHDVHYS